MQYTQQQRLAPEVPDESALYSPIGQLGKETYANNRMVSLSMPLSDSDFNRLSATAGLCCYYSIHCK